MPRSSFAVLLAACVLPLGGCVAGMAAGAAGMAVRAAQGEPESNAHLKPTAVQACSAQASRYGTVHIIDVEQRSASKLIVWGTVDDGKERRSFECGYGTKITGFKLRAITRQ
jgi:hypothetical protein